MGNPDPNMVYPAAAIMIANDAEMPPVDIAGVEYTDFDDYVKQLLDIFIARRDPRLKLDISIFSEVVRKINARAAIILYNSICVKNSDKVRSVIYIGELLDTGGVGGLSFLDF